MKVALVHDCLNQFGGAERVLWVIHEIFPEAPVYTSSYNPQNLPLEFSELSVVTSPIQKMPFASFFTKHSTFVYPLVFENFDLSKYEVVISSTTSFAKGVLVKPSTLHICYCNTPPRFLYHYETEVYLRQIWYLAPFLALLDNYFRIWDFNAAQRVDYFVTNSHHTASRIRKFYRRQAEVIYPPVEISKPEKFKIESQDYFLIVSRLVQYKRIDLAILACNKLNLNLKIIGIGKDEKRLKKMAGKTIEFIGAVDDQVLADYYAKCQAVIFLGEDDFGIVPVEAMGFGKPVIALGRGGALESVIRGRTGEFFYEEKVESLIRVIENFNPNHYQAEDCIGQAQKFSKDNFKKHFSKFVKDRYDKFR